MLDHRTFVRAALGGYVAGHFFTLLPDAVEVFSCDGMLADASASPLMRAFPNVLALHDGPMMVLFLVGLGLIAGLCMAFGARDRLAAGVALYVTACLFGRNPLIANPAMPYVGLLLFAWAAQPRSPGNARAWTPAVFRALWIAMAVGYTYSGLTKLAAPSWVDGDAFAAILANPLARSGMLRDLMVGMPPLLLRCCTWSVLGLEIAFAPLALSRRARPWLWGAMLAMHVGLLMLIDFADLTLGMVTLHVALFDPDWLEHLRKKRSRRPRRRAEDVVP